jgi:hypothetical protein
VEKVAGFLEVWCTDDSHEIVLSFPLLKPSADGLESIVLSQRHARHLAGVLIDHANYAEAEELGNKVGPGLPSLFESSADKESNVESAGGAAISGLRSTDHTRRLHKERHFKLRGKI